MNSIDKIQELFKQLSENRDKLSVILPQLYPIALEQKDFVGFCLLYLWGTPLGTCNEANQLYFQDATNMMRLAGISEEDATKIEATAAKQYLSMRDINTDNVPKDKIKIWSARELEDFLQRCDVQIADLKVPDGLNPLASYHMEQRINYQKLSIRSSKTQAEKQYAILHQLITSKLAEYQTKLSQMEEIGTTQENNMTPYEKLRKLRDEIDELIDKQMTYSLPEFKNWHKELGLFLSEKYGTQSKQYKNFIGRSFAPSLPHTSAQDYIDSCKRGLEITRTELSAYLDDMKGETTELAINIPKEKGEISMGKETKDRKKVFIVHGHDEAKRRELKEFLKDKLKLDPIVLSDQLPEKTLIDKFEKYAKQCSYAFVIYTPDDQVSNQEQKYFQARPNVIFELGWFYAHFAGSPNICILKQETDAKDNLIFSDLQGVEYLTFRKDIEEKFYKIQEILKARGIIN